jgi:hypothetical protein
MENHHRLKFYLSKLSIEIAEKNSIELGIDFNRYIDKVLQKAMSEMIADVDINSPFKVTKTEFKKAILPNKYEFIKKLAMKYNTNASSLVEILLVKGLD